MAATAGIIGHGYFVPSEVHRGIEDHVVRASRAAVRGANLEPSEIDRFYGYVTLAEYTTPNSLYQVHHQLGMPPRAMVVPINSEYSNFLLGLVHAAEAVAAGSARTSLVACGANWSGHPNLTRGHAAATGDAAGAAVVGLTDRHVIVDHMTETVRGRYQELALTVRPMKLNGVTIVPVAPRTPPTGVAGVVQDAVPTVALELLRRNGVRPGDATLMTHRGTHGPMDQWQPGAFPDTRANLTLAAYPIDLSPCFEEIDTDYTVIVAVAGGLHVTGVLLRN